MQRSSVQRIKARIKGIVRRQRDLYFPHRSTREYRAWMAKHVAQRASRYGNKLEPGLLSIVTAVWDGSPLGYLRDLANSIAAQIERDEAEWFILSNGCSRPDLLAFLGSLELQQFVTVHYQENNAGITGGLRACLQLAAGRYVLPVDADDRLYPDALRIVTAYVQAAHYPPLLYTDEDKVAGTDVYQPYFKPDWDPVLLANSAYVAHLGVADRQLALQLGGYGDKDAEGSADWDLFTRFANAGHRAIHIPEIVYSWRVHAQSTADDTAAKPYIRSSQEAVLRRFLQSRESGPSFDIEASPLFGPAAAHFRIIRHKPLAAPFIQLEQAGSLACLLAPAEQMAEQGGFVGLVGSGVQPKDRHWIEEALGLCELFPDTAMVGGRICTTAGVICDGPQVFGFRGICGCPDRGRHASDPGYFGQIWKQRSVSAVSARLAVIRAADLLNTLRLVPAEATLANLGCWIGAEAFRSGRRMIYTPFVEAIINGFPESKFDAVEEKAFLNRYGELIPDRRFYPEPFSLERGYQF